MNCAKDFGEIYPGLDGERRALYSRLGYFMSKNFTNAA
jgi:hypothetical protein